jgi:alcohol dehydrogenase (cytochrome c)
MMWANRNGFFYVLNRETGAFLSGAPFVKVNWASGLDAKGRPIPTPQPPGQPTWPATRAAPIGTRPRSARAPDSSIVSAWEGYASIFRKEPATYNSGAQLRRRRPYGADAGTRRARPPASAATRHVNDCDRR